MNELFYFTSFVAVISTLAVVLSNHMVHAILYLVNSFLALALAFYLLGAPFAAALQIIVYAGAILVLFVFVVFMFNFTPKENAQQQQWFNPKYWIGPGLIAALLLTELLYALQLQDGFKHTEVSPQQVGVLMFGPYLLAVEIASFLLLAGLVGAYHIAKPEQTAKEKQ